MMPQNKQRENTLKSQGRYDKRCNHLSQIVIFIPEVESLVSLFNHLSTFHLFEVLELHVIMEYNWMKVFLLCYFFNCYFPAINVTRRHLDQVSAAVTAATSTEHTGEGRELFTCDAHNLQPAIQSLLQC